MANKPVVGVAPVVNEQAQKAMAGAYQALAQWRDEVASIAERNGENVFEKMSAAAKAIGWPAEFVDATRQQLTGVSKMQLQVMNQMVDVWEQQMKAPGSAMSLPQVMMKQFEAMGFDPTKAMMGGMGGMGGIPGMPGMPGMPAFDPSQPFKFWMDTAEAWQKNWMQAMSGWMANMPGGPKR